MYERRLSMLPVVRDGLLVGVVRRSDALERAVDLLHSYSARSKSRSLTGAAFRLNL